MKVVEGGLFDGTEQRQIRYNHSNGAPEISARVRGVWSLAELIDLRNGFVAAMDKRLYAGHTRGTRPIE